MVKRRAPRTSSDENPLFRNQVKPDNSFKHVYRNIRLWLSAVCGAGSLARPNRVYEALNRKRGLSLAMIRCFSEIRSEGFKSLAEGQKVTFEAKMGPKGKQASNIQPA